MKMPGIPKYRVLADKELRGVLILWGFGCFVVGMTVGVVTCLWGWW